MAKKQVALKFKCLLLLYHRAKTDRRPTWRRASDEPMDLKEHATLTGVMVHPSSYVDAGVTIGPGTRIWHFCHILTGTTVGEGCSFGQNCMIGPHVVVGSGCKIQNNVSIYEGVILSDDVFCGPSCVFTNVRNPRSAYPTNTTDYHQTNVGRGATIGANATIVCGVSLGDHCFIGAGSVVTKDVPRFALMVGNPVRQIGWVCRCGERLDHTMACARCDDRYAELDGQLKLLP